MNSKLNIWFCTLVVFILAACHKPKTTSGTSISIVAGDNSDETYTDSSFVKIEKESLPLSDLVTAPLPFAYMATKSKVSFSGASKEFDNVNVNMRMQRDSIIWFSVSGVGFELARGIITRDTIIFIDKFHKEVIPLSYKTLSQKYNFELDFSLLQSMLIGDIPIPRSDTDTLLLEDQHYILSQTTGKVKNTNYIGQKNAKLLKVRAEEVRTQNTISLDYEDFRVVDQHLFPFLSLIRTAAKSVKDGKVTESEVKIRYTKVEILSDNPGFPFNVPVTYKQRR